MTSQPAVDPIHFSASLAPAEVELSVRDLARSVAFYREVLGLQVRSHTSHRAELGTAERPLIVLHALDNPQPPQRSTGLYHLALLLPGRADLGRFLKHVSDLGLRVGASDHLVSEAIYLNDPDGHGIEVYRDRLRSEWPQVDGQLVMATDPLDAAGVLGSSEGTVWTGLPSGTVMGHIHLKVSDQQTATAFYQLIGFELTVQFLGASFLSAGGYHHHLGLNVWESRAAPAPAEDTPALRRAHFQLSRDDLAGLKERLQSAGLPFEEGESFADLTDPAGNQLRFSVN
ncbi:VOC family protein [Deinococcus psychrotolerans]|uniref:VOC family protein n=1 Tax=Deinococcus psychrotolerans TaxID=2489213 RepID=A0A3G8YB49_9DEIO|nr:VOC family protein [Deinococcus psychrotolerans]AZI41427.1 VOC family protein [Deinococcus psychrotolerans]